MKIYLASRYSRDDEMRQMRTALAELGHTVTSRWIDGGHQISDQGLSDEAKASERTRFALEDLEDLMAAECVISFTEQPRGTNSRGGRHVEFGIALGIGKRVIVVGYRENVFHCLPEVEFFDGPHALCDALASEQDEFPEPPLPGTVRGEEPLIAGIIYRNDGRGGLVPVNEIPAATSPGNAAG